MSGPVIFMKDLQVDVSGDVLDYIFFNQRFLIITNSINGLASRMDGYDATINDIMQIALNRTNMVLGPFLEQLQDAALYGFLTVEADIPLGQPPLSLTVNTDMQFTCTSSGLSVFTPTPYVLALDVLDPNNWGILSTTSYDATSGQYVGHVVYCTKTQQSDKWSLSCNSALPAAMMQLLTQAQAAAASATSEAAQVTQLLNEVTQLIQIVQSGPVVSVCNKAGVVTLVPADITGLLDALNACATVGALNTGLAQKQNSSAALTTFAALPSATDKLPYFSGVGAMAVATFTAFARTLVGAVDAPTARGILGLGDASTHPASDFATPAQVSTIIGQTNIHSDAILAISDDQTGTSYIFVSADYGRTLTMTNAAAITATLPNNLPKGWNALICQGGAGVITFAAGAGVTLVNRQSQYKSAGQYAMLSLMCLSNPAGNNPVIVLGGDTSA
jgi:hypothetical protein